MKAPPSLASLKRAHERAVQAFAKAQTVPFQTRASWLLAQIKRELPNIGGVVYCNGESWLVSSSYPNDNDESELITYRNPRAEDDEPPTYRDRMRNAFDFANECGDEPDVSSRCLAYLRELYELTGYCEEPQAGATLNPFEERAP